MQDKTDTFSVPGQLYNVTPSDTNQRPHERRRTTGGLLREFLLRKRRRDTAWLWCASGQGSVAII